MFWKNCLTTRQFLERLKDTSVVRRYVLSRIRAEASSKLKVVRKVDRTHSIFVIGMFFRDFFKGNGAAYVTRTRDPIITNDVLYRLS